MLDWDIVEKMQKDEERRNNIKYVKRDAFRNNFIESCPWYIKEELKSNPNVNLLSVAQELGLEKEYKDALNSIGYSVNDYILFALSCCRDIDSFENINDYEWLTSDFFDVRMFKNNHILIESNLGKIEVYKNHENWQKYKLLLPHKNEIFCEDDKEDCHLLTYEYVLRSQYSSDFITARTGIVNDVYGPMIHSWVNLNDRSSVDLANGYTMKSDDYGFLHNVSEYNDLSKSQIMNEKIPHSYTEGKNLVRSLPYLMYKQK